MNGREVTFVDLDIDLVYRNGRWMVVDEDEFTVNALKFSYPPELIERVKKELKDLEQRIEQKQFPFDGSIEKFIEAVPKR
jgi:protein associated with RNAse G/E